ncbi:MAG: nitrous oxide reductase accessory protein NosL [Caldilineaceae bacterium]
MARSSSRNSQWAMRNVATILVFALLLLNACSRGEHEIRPAEIHYGEDVCAECGMIISDAKYASSISLQIGTGRYQTVMFDDIGDMMAYLGTHSDAKVVGWFVHDYDSEEWLDATTAFFVVSEQIKSPMNHGIAAYAQQSSAEARASQTHGKVAKWDELQKLETEGHSHS